MRILELSEDNFAIYQDGIRQLEHGVSYPLGNDRFTIDHGSDYYAFFRRLGALSYFIALDGDRVAAVAAAVLRQIPRSALAAAESAWYICDLKVHPDYRKRRIPWQMFIYGFPRKYWQCGRGYAISMNPGDGSPNSIVRLATHFVLAPTELGATVGLYSLSAQSMRALHPALELARGKLSYLSLAGVKDIVLQRTQASMPLLHVQFGPAADHVNAAPSPIDDHVHMFCVPTSDPLAQTLLQLGHAPNASASVICHRMSGWDWSFVLTSDI
jgi:hypothetical protein